jgi:hypothetical protein
MGSLLSDRLLEDLPLLCLILILAAVFERRFLLEILNRRLPRPTALLGMLSNRHLTDTRRSDWEQILKLRYRISKLEERLRAEERRICATTQVQSPLLRLPGELRNQIYGYIFDSETDEQEAVLIPQDVYRDPTGPCVLAHNVGTEDDLDFRPINNLRYVCRQLHFETRNIIKLSQYTMICFPPLTLTQSTSLDAQPVVYSPAAAAGRFLRECHVNHIKALDRIYIHTPEMGRALDPRADRRLIKRHCCDIRRLSFKFIPLLECRPDHFWQRDKSDTELVFEQNHKGTLGGRVLMYFRTERRERAERIRFLGGLGLGVLCQALAATLLYGARELYAYLVGSELEGIGLSLLGACLYSMVAFCGLWVSGLV